MALRTTADKVKEIMPDTDLDTGAIDAYISIASSMVDDLDATELTAARLAEIERWLTAHLISVTVERRPVKERIGDAEVTYDRIFGPGLQGSEYGQVVAQLDTTNTLVTLGKKKISIYAITSFDN